MTLLGLIEPYPWGVEYTGEVEPPLTNACSHCGKEHPTHVLYQLSGSEGKPLVCIGAPCLPEYMDDKEWATKIHQQAMVLRAESPDLVSPSNILGDEGYRAANFAVDVLGERPDEELTEEERGWVLLCRFPTIRSIHSDKLLDIWAAWLQYKEPEPEVVHTGAHLGAPGDRLELNVKVLRINGPFSGEYGDSYMCVMETEESKDLVVWWTGENLGFDEGKSYRIKGTVKKHDMYDGRKQTHVQRVKEVV